MPTHRAARPSRRASLAVLAATALLLPALACKSSDANAKNTVGTPPAAAIPGTVGSPATTGGARVADGAVPLPAGPGADSTALRAAADSGRILGAPGAKAWLIMASDFQCPYCKMWHDQSFESIRHEYVDAGKVRIAYMNFPLDQHVQAMQSAEAAMCASAQGKFWPFHTALFTTQDAWGKPGDQSAAFEAIATRTGLDLARYRTCTQTHVMRALILADRDRMASRGVQSTPSFFIVQGNGSSQTMAGALPTDDFRKAIDAALGQPAR